MLGWNLQPVSNLCTICHTRRARRTCPALSSEICAQCCGAERENSIDCPAECSYLRDARLHEAHPPLKEEDVPHRDVALSETFVRQNEPLVFTLALALRRSMETSGAAGKAVDGDARAALEASIRTYRTLQSGLIYETRPENPYASAIQDKLQAAVEELRKGLAEAGGAQTLRDADVLGCLVFLQRLELQNSNGRRRGRAFFDFLREYVSDPEMKEATI